MVRRWLLIRFMVHEKIAFSYCTHSKLKWRKHVGSVVEIDKHTVQYKVRGKTMEKECFRRVLVSFKACWKGFLVGCRPYLVVDSLNGRFRGQLVVGCAIDGHNWLFLVAYGVLETECVESWTWFLDNLH
jgi:hypothetical protein